MKGTIISKPLEYTIEALGEKWHQGDKLTGSLTIKNNGAEKVDLPFLKVAILEGNYKKVKAKNAKGWSSITEVVVAEKLTLNSSEEKNYPFEFQLAENSSITDKNGSLFLVYFDKEDEFPKGNIELVIEPKQLIKNVLQIFENFLRFKVKEIKSGKGSLEVKLVPPTSRELSNVDSLMLNISEIEKSLTLHYHFDFRVLNLTGATMQSEKTKKDIENVFTAKEYLIYGDSVNQDFIVESVQKVLSEVKTKML